MAGRKDISADMAPKAAHAPLQDRMFADMAPALPPGKVISPRNPIWTRHKACLIEQYLRLFVLVTGHGTYLDAFAGPQEPEAEAQLSTANDLWAARLVLQSQVRARRIRKFVLCEKKRPLVQRLEQLRVEQLAVDAGRSITVLQGDCNVSLPTYLRAHPIGDKEATFCVLDQHTFECRWDLVQFLASHKSGRKIELFYFLANHWFNRAALNLGEEGAEGADAWWGSADWRTLISMTPAQRAERLAHRFLDELGYRYAFPWPILDEKNHIMFYMIHATDHPAAGDLMRRAYETAVAPPEDDVQLSFWLEEGGYLENPEHDDE